MENPKENVIVRRGADVGSNYHLLLAKINTPQERTNQSRINTA